MTRPARARRPAMSLLELVAVVTLVGFVAAVAILRLRPEEIRSSCAGCCAVQSREIELQARLWKRAKGDWPAADLHELGADPAFFPKGLPICPADGSPYAFDRTTGRIVGHAHP